jgi:catechol 2,3-dioxygenase-like lactoylglutathione lyase family enzyme
MVTRFIHVNIVCSNLERSIAFYRDVLGASVHQHLASNGSDLRPCMGMGADAAPHYKAVLLYFNDNERGGPYIDLLEWYYDEGDDSDRVARPPVEAQDYGLVRLALQVSDIEEAEQRVRASGAEIVGPIQDEPVGPWRLRLFLCKDPDGTLIELVEFPEGMSREQKKTET